jgi:hypothetical protein
MIAFVGADFDANGFTGERIELDAVARVIRPPIAPRDLTGLKMLDAAAKHGTGGIVERHVQMSLGRVFGLQPLDDVALDDERTLFSLQPNLFDDNDRGIGAL